MLGRDTQAPCAFLAHTLIGALTGGTVGFLTGVNAGEAAGFNEVANNYLNHEDASRLLALQKMLNNGILTIKEAKECRELAQKDTTTNGQLRTKTPHAQ